MANLQDNIRISTQVDMQQLDILISKLTQLGVNLTSVSSQARNLQSSLNQTTQATNQQTTATNQQVAATNNLVGQTNRATQANNGLFQSLNSLTKLRSELITLFGAYSIGSFAQQMVEAQSKVESFQLSMKNLLGDAYGTKLTNDLKTFTVNTPLNFEEVIQATNTLVGSFKAAGASSKTIGTEIPQILESLGNSAAALGGENRLGRLIYAFSQVQATGRLMGTEVRQITETGFPLLAVMSERSGKSVQQLQKDISDGKVSFEQFKEAILSAGKEGGVFAGSMDIMANTVRGRIDKMREQVFFALANIGNQFNDSAKRAIDFSADIVQALFGTESATKRTIDVIKTSVATWIAYQGAVKLAASQTVIATAIDRASLIIRGQMVLANISLTGSTESFTFAQLRAAAAARSFNTVAASNPLGLLVLAIGAVTAGYQIYSASVDEAIEKQNKLSSDIASAVAPIKTQKQEFNNLANAVLSTTLPIEEQARQLNRLKLEYPQLLKGVQDLSTAEKILNENKIKTNITFDYRNEKLNQLKAKYPEQLKGIDNLSEAEDKLAGVVRIVNRDFAILSATMENNVRLQNQVAGANENFAKKIKAQAELAKLMAGQTGSSLVDFGGNILDNSKALIEAKQKEIKGYDDSAKAFVKSAEVIRAENQRLTDKLVYNYNEIPKVIENTGKEGKEKALKYQNDTDKQKAILQEANSLREQQETRDNQQKILDLEKEYAELRVNNAKGSQAQKVKSLQDIEKKYREDSANLTRTWDKKDLDALQITQKEINDIRSSFRALNSENEKKSLKEQIDAIEARYKLEIEKILKSKQPLEEKRLQIVKNIITEEKEISVIKAQIEAIKNSETIRGLAAKQIKKDADDIIEKSQYRTRLELQQLELQNDLAKVETQRYDKILDLVSGIAGETKELFNLNDALRKSKDAKEDLIAKESLLADIISKGNLLSKEGVKAQKEADDAKVKSIEATNLVALTSYQLLYKAIETIFNGIKNSIANSMNLVADSYRESNKIFQEFVVKKREADLKNYEDDLKTRLKLAEGNFDVQLKLLDEYLTKAEQLMDERSIIDKFASDLEYLNTLGAEKNEQAAKMLQELSLNPLNNIKSMFSNTLAAIGKASDGLSKEQERIYRQTISNSQNAVDKLEWQRDNTVEILDQMAEAYRDKYAEQTDVIKDELERQLDIVDENYDRQIEIVKDKYSQQTQAIKDETDKQLDIIRQGLDSGLERISNSYDSQKDIIGRKYQDILDNNIRYTDTAFEEQLRIWNSAREKQEQIITQGRDNEIAILKEKYSAGNITLEEYLSRSQAVQTATSEALLSFRTKFYDDLEAKQLVYNNNEYANLKAALDKNLITQKEYDTQLGVLDAIVKQRSSDIKSIVKKDRDEELAYLKQFYYDAKVFEEQKAADAIFKINEKAAGDLKTLKDKLDDDIKKAEQDKADTILKINTESATKLAGLQAGLATTIAGIEKQKRDTILSYNSQIFEENRKLALAEAEISKAQGKAAAWKNPFTAKATIKNIEEAFNEIIAQILSAVNPFAAQRLNDNVIDNQVPVVTDGSIFFEKGTDNTSKDLKGKVVDNKGGKVAVLHPDEAVFSKANMSEMTKALGYRPSRDEVIEKFKMGIVNMKLSHSPYVIPKLESKGIGSVDKVVSELKSVANEMRRIQTPQVIMNERGIKTYLLGVNSKVQAKLDRFK